MKTILLLSVDDTVVVFRYTFPYLTKHFAGSGVSTFRIFTDYRLHDGSVKGLGSQQFADVTDIRLSRCLNGMAHGTTDMNKAYN